MWVGYKEMFLSANKYSLHHRHGTILILWGGGDYESLSI